jgi:hypothetical protein
MDIDAIIEATGNRLQKEDQTKLYQQLTEAINWLIANDFQRLVQVLYRIDVPEQKLKRLLQEHKETNAANIIADLIIQRQMEKKKLREHFRQNDQASDEEKW